MTRETRIGLLVGMVFIIMFGLVLSELAGTSPDRPASGPAVRDDTALLPTPIIDPGPTPRGSGEAGRPVRIAQRTYEATSDGVVRSRMSRPGAAGDRTGVVVSRMHRGSADTGPLTLAATRTRTYAVQQADNWVRIAQKVYGPAHWREYERIRQANRDLLARERSIPIGTRLVIPPLDGATPSPAAAVSRSGRPPAGGPYTEMDLGQLRRYFSASGGAPARSGRVYVSQSGDNLTSVARRTLGDGSHAAVMKIYNANRDKLDSPDVLPVGVELVIPG